MPVELLRRPIRDAKVRRPFEPGAFLPSVFSARKVHLGTSYDVALIILDLKMKPAEAWRSPAGPLGIRCAPAFFPMVYAVVVIFEFDTCANNFVVATTRAQDGFHSQHSQYAARQHLSDALAVELDAAENCERLDDYKALVRRELERLDEAGLV